VEGKERNGPSGATIPFRVILEAAEGSRSFC